MSFSSIRRLSKFQIHIFTITIGWKISQIIEGYFCRFHSTSYSNNPTIYYLSIFLNIISTKKKILKFKTIRGWSLEKQHISPIFFRATCIKIDPCVWDFTCFSFYTKYDENPYALRFGWSSIFHVASPTSHNLWLSFATLQITTLIFFFW